MQDTLNFVNEAMDSFSPAEEVTIEEHSLSVGQFYPQGDVALIKLDKVPEGAVEVKVEAKVTPGNTLGSQHVWDNTEGMRCFKLQNPKPTDGLIYVLKNKATLTHPQHANQTYHAGFIGQTRYQRNLAGERVQD